MARGLLCTMLSITSLASCSGGARVAFHASDPRFRPVPGATPPVYLTTDIPDIARAQVRSVGIIETTVPERDGIKAATEAAARKGRELGCWIVVEHEAFARLRAGASLAYGARVLLAHGPGHIDPGTPRAGRRQKIEFDCVLPVMANAAIGI